MENPRRWNIEYGPIIAAVLTATASLTIYGSQQIRHFDERLDALEQATHVLIDGQGGVRPSREALQNYYRTEALSRRIDRLENKQ